MSTGATSLMTMTDVASRFKLSRAGIYRLSARAVDPLPYYRIGGVRRYDPDEVSVWLARQRDGEIRVELVDVEC